MSTYQRLDLSSLQKALVSLDEALTALQQDPTNKFIRDAVIQRFEYSYELCAKMLKRYLEISMPNSEEIDHMAFPDVIRTGAETGLLQKSWDVWKKFRDARNITSHTYDEKKANLVCKTVPSFLKEGQFLLAQLEKRNRPL